MKLKIKAVLASAALAAALIMMPQVNALADGPPFGETEPNNFNFEANKIVLYDCVYSELPQGDKDWYKIYIPKSNTYEFHLGSTNGAAALPATLTATIYDGNGNEVFSGCPNGSGIIVYDGTLNGLYYVQIKDDQNTNTNIQYDFEFYPKSGFGGSIYRFAGLSRYETSYSIFKNNWSYCDYAVITTGENFPDALSAAPLAKKFNAPIILTNPQALSSDVENQLKTTGVKNVFIIGGTGAVSKNVEDKLISMGIKCTRISGQDRYETSLAIAQYLDPVGAVAVATGADFPDALSIASIAACLEMPILLVDKNSSNEKVCQYIKDTNTEYSFIIGGTGVVSTATQNSILQVCQNTARIAGANRYETNINVLEAFGGAIRPHEMFFATGLNFPDALSGSVLAAAGMHPVVLIDKDVDQSTRYYLTKNSNSVIGKCIFGGEGVIPTTTVSQFFN